MKLVITEPCCLAVEHFDGLKALMTRVRKDLKARGLSPEEVQKHIYSLSFEMHRVRGTNVIDDEGNLIVGYRITR